MKENHPITFCIFGATGDLAKQKLIPSLFDLYKKKLLPEKFFVVGFSRREWSHLDYQDFVREIFKNKKVNKRKLNSFLKNFYYCNGNMDNKETYQNLSKLLQKIDSKNRTCTHKMFYLAVSPNFYESVFKNLSKTGLSIPCKNPYDEAWSRILVEKPFGEDRKKAKKLDSLLGKIYEESQIFRIDHYLAKHTVESLISFRFANTFFEPAWNNQYIEKIEFKAYEARDVDNRISFFDGIGALRDVGQNHMLQMAALVMMNLPKDLSSQSIRESRSELLKSLKFDKNKAFRAQYRGYRAVDPLLKKSLTETYFRLIGESKDSRWKGVPLVFESGKALGLNEVSITIHFKKNINFINLPDNYTENNYIKFNIQPKENIEMSFWSKKPDFKFTVKPQKFILKEEHKDKLDLPPDAYERVLYDAIQGDQTLFVSTDEVHAQWESIMPILDFWKKEGKINFYDKGEFPKVKFK